MAKVLKAKIFKCGETQVFNKKGLMIFENYWYWLNIKSKKISRPFSSKDEAIEDAHNWGYVIITKRKVSIVCGKDIIFKRVVHDTLGNEIQDNKWYYDSSESLHVSNAYNSRERAEQIAISKGYEVINLINKIEVIIIQGRNSNKSHDINCDALCREKWYYDFVDKGSFRMSSEAFDSKEEAIKTATHRLYKIVSPKEKSIKTKQLPIVFNLWDFYNIDNEKINCTTSW
jgi:hypothetical protein